ncbi:sodium channel protein type 4 subunit alpha A-like isoform X3 [Dermacentor albipictus]|uniref:sodium channel protein type 4 subunit alpha A-like isoform X3 n=1 Tax=Dermacentor albipictus TaxID=60249 RepID=UPI0038FD3288
MPCAAYRSRRSTTRCRCRAIELLGTAVGLGPHLQLLSSFRPFRLFKVLTIFLGLRDIVNTIIKATTRMLELIVLLLFCILVFATFGLQMFMSVLKRRCVVSKERLGVVDAQLYRRMANNRTFWMRTGVDEDEDRDRLGFACGNLLAAYTCEPGFSCVTVDVVEERRVFPSYDNVVDAVLTTFNIFSLDNWNIPYNMLLQAVGPTCFPLFLCTVMFGSAYLINLMLAVTVHTYVGENNLKRARKQKMEQGSLMDLTLFQEICDFEVNVDHLYVQPLVSLAQIPSVHKVRQLRFKQRLRRGEGEALTRELGFGAFADMVTDEANAPRPLLRAATLRPPAATRRMHSDETYEQPIAAAAAPVVGAARAQSQPAGVRADIPLRADWATVRMVCLAMEKSPILDLTIHVLIILSTLFLALDGSYANAQFKSMLTWGNMAASVAFSVEMAIKLSARGWSFFHKKFSVLDLGAVICSITSDLLVLLRYEVGVRTRFLRLFRLVYVARTWDTLFYMLNMMLSLLKPLLNLLLVIMLVVVAFAVAAEDLFDSGDRKPQSRWNSRDFLHSVLLMVRLFCGDMFDPLVNCFHEGHGRLRCVAFYSSVFFVGNYVLLNVFLAFLLSSFNVDRIVERNSPGEILFEKMVCSFKSWCKNSWKRLWHPSSDETHALPTAERTPGWARNAWLAAQHRAEVLTGHRAFRLLVALLIVLSSIVLCLEGGQSTAMVRGRLELASALLTVLLSVDVALVLVAKGPHAYFSSGWHLLDFIVQSTSLLYEVLAVIGVQGSVINVLRATRALRPVRIVSLLPGMKLLVDALASSVPSIGNVLVVCAFIWIIFGVVGVSMFAGRLWHCVDARGQPLDPDLVPDRATCHMLGFSWTNENVNFDNLAEASLALLQVATFEGWIEVIENVLDIEGVDLQPRREANPWSLIYFAIFLVIGAFLVFNLFVGVVIDNFYAKKRQLEEVHSEPTASESQRRYARSLRRLLAQRPVSLVARPAGRVRGFLYDVAASKELAVASAALALLNGMLLASERYEWNERQRAALGRAHLVFLVGHAAELLLRAAATGAAFFAVKWNQFELCALVLSLLGDVVLLSGVSQSRPEWVLLRGLRTLAILRVFRSLVSVRGVRQLVLIFAASVPAFINIALLLFLVMFVYGVLGVSLFGTLRSDDSYSGLVNFGQLWRALLLLFRLSTTSAWNEVLGWLLPAGKGLAVAYLVSYLFISNFIIFNSYVAVLLAGYEQALNTELSGLSDADLVDFAAAWARLDVGARRTLPLAALPSLLDSLPRPLRLPRPNTLALAIMDVPLLSGDRVHYVHLLQSLLRVRMNVYEPLCEPLQRSLDAEAAAAYPELRRPDMRPVSGTMQRQQEQRAAHVLAEFFVRGCERLRLERAACTVQRAWRAHRLRRTVTLANRLQPFPLFLLTQTNLQYW